jgi:hypothetical protein
MDYNNKKSKEKGEYMVRSIFICGAVYIEWVSFSSHGEAWEVDESRPKPLGFKWLFIFILRVYLYKRVIKTGAI